MNRTILLLLTLCIVGCDQRDIETYQAPKEPAPTLVADALPQAMPPIASAEANPHELSWTLPEGWRQLPQPGAMRVATFETGQGQNKLTIAITVFPGDVGGLLANINRWRRQVKLPPVESVDQQPMQTFTVDDRTARIVNLPGMNGAIIDDTDRTWFVKMTGPTEGVAGQDETFTQFIRSLKWADA